MHLVHDQFAVRRGERHRAAYRPVRRATVMMAVFRDRFTELILDCGLGAVALVVVMYMLLRMFRRNRKNGDSGNGPHDEPEF
jgi:predicted membrane-bound mannosyltransferase